MLSLLAFPEEDGAMCGYAREQVEIGEWACSPIPAPMRAQRSWQWGARRALGTSVVARYDSSWRRATFSQSVRFGATDRTEKRAIRAHCRQRFGNVRRDERLFARLDVGSCAELQLYHGANVGRVCRDGWIAKEDCLSVRIVGVIPERRAVEESLVTPEAAEQVQAAARRARGAGMPPTNGEGARTLEQDSRIVRRCVGVQTSARSGRLMSASRFSPIFPRARKSRSDSIQSSTSWPCTWPRAQNRA